VVERRHAILVGLVNIRARVEQRFDLGALRRRIMAALAADGGELPCGHGRLSGS
jgi:hypothetical protein